jgi:hypothetical protein
MVPVGAYGMPALFLPASCVCALHLMWSVVLLSLSLSEVWRDQVSYPGPLKWQGVSARAHCITLHPNPTPESASRAACPNQWLYWLPLASGLWALVCVFAQPSVMILGFLYSLPHRVVVLYTLRFWAFRSHCPRRNTWRIFGEKNLTVWRTNINCI